VRRPEGNYHAALEILIGIPHVHPYAVSGGAAIVICVEGGIHAGTGYGCYLEDVRPAEEHGGDPGYDRANGEEGGAPLGSQQAVERGADRGGGSGGMAAEVEPERWARLLDMRLLWNRAQIEGKAAGWHRPWCSILISYHTTCPI